MAEIEKVKKPKTDPYGGDVTPGPSTIPSPKPKGYSGGGKVRGVGVAQRGYGRGKIC